ncbi:MAG: RagB/SusD family nutrient uptake outer membrane protein, partial [Prevotella sp.]|nr:RagB/SusD family nutrient uptake outer membrane protein [Prevotella sp.]
EIDPSTPIKKLSRDDGVISENYPNWPATDNWFTDNGGTTQIRILRSTDDARVQKDPYEYQNEFDGQTYTIYKMGQDGPKAHNNAGNSTLTGFHGRKFLNLGITVAETDLSRSTQSWIEIRYAEVLLNRAEAAVELAQNGDASYNGVNMLQDAFECMNDIRDRAGAELLTSPAELSTAPGLFPKGTGKGSFVEAPTRGLQLVRVERYKELAFEAKIYWDLNRWFTADTQINQYRKRGLFAFMFTKGATVNEYGNPEGKYIYDARATESGSDRVTVGVNDYYETIPATELKNNPYLQKNRNQ